MPPNKQWKSAISKCTGTSHFNPYCFCCIWPAIPTPKIRRDIDPYKQSRRKIEIKGKTYLWTIKYLQLQLLFRTDLDYRRKRWCIYFFFPIHLFLSETQHFRNSHCFSHQNTKIMNACNLGFACVLWGQSWTFTVQMAS